MGLLNDNLLFKNKSKLLKHKNSEVNSDNSLGAVIARAGIGKTAFIVQLAINMILQKNNVLHVSINEPVNKVNFWYKEVLIKLTEIHDLSPLDALWESIESNRFIMTFKVEKFRLPVLKERLGDLIEQQIFKPDLIVIDGLPLDGYAIDMLNDLKAFIKKQKMHMWFTIITHRHERSDKDGFPMRLLDLKQVFNDIIQLKHNGNRVIINSIKESNNDSRISRYFIDPSTMLIRDLQTNSV